MMLDVTPEQLRIIWIALSEYVAANEASDDEADDAQEARDLLKLIDAVVIADMRRTPTK